MIEETAVPFFNTLSVPDLSCYPAIMSGQFFCFEKENGERIRGNDRKTAEVANLLK